MKRNHFILITFLLAIAFLTVSCQLPQPATDTPTPTLGIQQQATNTPLPSATQPPAVTSEKPTATQVPTQPPQAATATSVPPTSLPQTVTPPADATRIEFAAGATSESVDGVLEGGESKSYILRASAGQTMRVDVWSPNGDVYLEVYGLDGKKLAEYSQKSVFWTGNLSSTQDYVVAVTAGDGRTSYSVTFTIPAGTTPGATTTVAPGELDPYAEYGTPTFSDPMNRGTTTNWASPGEQLPNTDNIQLFLADDKLYVAGKQLGWATWWFSWPTLDDFFLQMTADSGTCSGKDAYGLIFRGPPHQAGVSYGYVVAFSCDGSYWIFRLDGIDPWRAVDFVTWTKSDHINAGANQRNVVGVRAVGSQLSFYANGHLLTEVTDNRYSKGRYGVFVRPDVSPGYTYRPVKIEYWDLGD